jgi:nucleoside-diphosphate-sugar epimerase
MVYGHFHGKTVTEDSQCNPLGIYDTLKYSGEQIVKAYHRVFKTPYTIIRPSALYGERCVSRRVSQIFIENAVQSLDISVNGDGSDKLDFTYIEDFVHGVILAVENENSINETFNMTYGEARTIGEMAEILKNHFDGINISYSPKDSLTPDRGTLSVDKARDLLGYKPQNPIDVGYPKYIEWYKNFWAQLKT